MPKCFRQIRQKVGFAGVGLGDFVCVAQSWIVALTLRLKEVVGFAPKFVRVGL